VNAAPVSFGDPAALVRDLPTITLAEAVAGDHVFAFLDDEAGVRFRCPQCRRLDCNGGTAELVDDLRWRCRRCDQTWTRYYLERIVLEDADYLARAYRITEVERVG